MSFANQENLPGRLRQRVLIEQPIETPDASGGFITSWHEVATVWAEIRSVRVGRSELAVAGKLQSENWFEMTMRYRNDITTKMRVTYNGISYAIRVVDDVNSNGVTLELLLEQGVPA